MSVMEWTVVVSAEVLVLIRVGGGDFVRKAKVEMAERLSRDKVEL